MPILTYDFSTSNTIKKNTGEAIAFNAIDYVSPPVPSSLYDDNDLSITYYDTIYIVRIKQINSDTQFKFINVPWDFTLKKANTILDSETIVFNGSTFNVTITINTNNVKFIDCTFNTPVFDLIRYPNSDPGSSLILYNIGLIDLELYGCTFTYNNYSIPIEGIAMNRLTITGTTIKIIPHTSEINIYNLFNLTNYPGFTFELDPDNDNNPFIFSEISEGLTFKLNGYSVIQNTVFSRSCIFNLNGCDLTFSGCTFDNNINDTFLCETYNTISVSSSELKFTKYNGNYNIFNPRKSQIYNNRLWNWNEDTLSDISSTNINPSSVDNFVKITLDIPSSLDWLNDLYYFNQCFFELGSTGTFSFGTINRKLNQELNLIVPDYIEMGGNGITTFGQNGVNLLLTVFGNESLNIYNYSGNTSIFIQPSTILTASGNKNCINLDNSSTFNAISIAGTYTNNNNTFIDSDIEATINGDIVLNIVSYYNMSNENRTIIGTSNYTSDKTLTTYINGNNIDLIVGNTLGNTQNGKNYNFLVDNESSLGSDTDINIPCTFTMNSNLTVSGTIDAIATFNAPSVIDLTFDNIKVNASLNINMTSDLIVTGNSLFNSSSFVVSVTGNITINNSVINGTGNYSASNSLSISNSSLTGNTNYNSSGIGGLGLVSFSNSVMSGVANFNCRGVNINNSQLLGSSDFHLYASKNQSYITDSIISRLIRLYIPSGSCNLLEISNTSITYSDYGSYIEIGTSAGLFKMADSIITTNSSYSFSLNILGSSNNHTIDRSNINCFLILSVSTGNLTIDQSNLNNMKCSLGGSTGGIIDITNSFLNTSLTSAQITDQTNLDYAIYIAAVGNNNSKVTINNSVIDLNGNKKIFSNDNIQTAVEIKNSTLNINYNSPDMLILTQNKNWFDINNVFNFTTSTVTISNYTNSKDINIASNVDTTISISTLTNPLIVNSVINIYGNKKKKTLTTPSETYSYNHIIENTTSNNNITLDNFSLYGLTNLVSNDPIYYINYQASNNTLDGTLNNLSVTLSRINFGLTPNVHSINFGLSTVLNNSSNTVLTSNPNYRLYVISNGTYYIGMDDLVVLNNNDQNIYILSTDLLNVSLLGTKLINKFIYRFIVNFEQLENSTSNTIFSLTVNTSGLNLIDNRTESGNNNLIKLTGSTINVANVSDSVNALSISINTTASNITIDSTTFTTSNDDSYIFINNNGADYSTGTFRKVIINDNNIWNGSVKYFIENYDKTFLEVNSAPSSGVSRNNIYWPRLIDMSLESGPTSYPLSGTAVKFAESWDITTFSDIDNTLSDVSGGLSTTWYDSVIKTLKFVQAYSSNAFGNTILSSFTYTLDKEYTNTTTNHTGKFAGTSDSINILDATAVGYLTADISFSVNASKLVLMPPTNPVALQITVNELPTIEFNKKIYEINNSENITKEDVSKSIREYLNDNFFIYNPSNITAESLYMTDTTFSMDDGTGNPINGLNSETLAFKINPIIGDKFYFLTEVDITLSQTGIKITYGTDSSPASSYTITYPDIDDENTNGESDSVDIRITPNIRKWTTTSLTVELKTNVDYYLSTLTNPLITFTINNQIDDTMLYTTKLGQISGNTFIYNVEHTFQSPDTIQISKNLTLDYANFTAPDTTDINGVYEWNLGSFGLVVPSISGNDNTLSFTPSAQNIKLGGVNVSSGNVGTVQIVLERWDYINTTWVKATSTAILPTETDILIRYIVKAKVEDVQDLYYGTEYDLSFQLANTNFDESSQIFSTITIDTFTIPLIVALTRVDGNGNLTNATITRDDSFYMKVELSGRLNGNVLLSFTDEGTNVSDRDGTPYNYNGIINDNIKIIENGTTQDSDYLVNMGNQNNITINYTFNPLQYMISDIKMNCAISELTYNTEGNKTFIPASNYDLVTIDYNETSSHSITITMDKLLNATGFEELENINFNNFGNNNKLTLTDADGNSYLFAPEFTKKIGTASVEQIATNNLAPLNKFTKYFIAINTSFLGIDVVGNGIDVNGNYTSPDVSSSAFITTNFKFRDENGDEVTDVEVIQFTGNLSNVTNNNILIESLNFENRFNGTNYSDSGNNVLIFRRNPNATTESVYTMLKVYYYFSNLDNSNYGTLPSTEQLLGIVDYSNVGLATTSAAIVKIGNFNLVTSGDGKFLMISKSIPASLAIPDYLNEPSNIISGSLFTVN